MIDVLIFPGYGIGRYPDFLFNKKEEIPKFPKNRVGDVVRKIRDAAVCIDYSNTKTLINFLKTNKEAVVRSNDDKNMFYTWNKSVHWLEILQIVSVDNSCPWTIDEYDGAESIYYPKLNILDEKLNFCEVGLN